MLVTFTCLFASLFYLANAQSIEVRAALWGPVNTTLSVFVALALYNTVRELGLVIIGIDDGASPAVLAFDLMFTSGYYLALMATLGWCATGSHGLCVIPPRSLDLWAVRIAALCSSVPRPLGCGHRRRLRLEIAGPAADGS
jgi:hypothetical protein